ncbi:MAG: hypothetical protein CMF96_04625 [Candidatus Marinimicrobia bacterium]|nr:hypothetical protein [Candidatus Neomarinimicrobiota bacterium]
MKKNYLTLIYIILVSTLLAIQFPNLKEHDLKEQFRPKIEFNKNLSNFALDKTIDEMEYIVGPGDQFNFTMVSTSKVVTLSLQISPTGKIQIPAIGSIHIDGLILKKAIKKIIDYCIQQYPDAKININLEKVRQIKVNIIGAIDLKISQLTLTSTQRLSDVYEIVNSKINEKNYNQSELKLEDEITEIKTLSTRNITLIRGNKYENIDLEQYFILGDINSNPYLLQNDIIKFSFKDKTIGIYGGIMNDGDFEFIEGDNLHNIIELAGGFSSDSDGSYIEITRYKNNQEAFKIILDSENNHKSFFINEFDHILIRKVQNYKQQELITIEGEIKYPGVYSISDGLHSIGSLIDRCGGVTDIGDSNSIIINNILIEETEDSELRRILQIPVENRNNSENSYIKARNGITKGLIRSSNKKFTNSIYDFIISPGDHIVIPKKIDYVEIIGAIKHPGRYPYIIKFDPLDYIKLSGGLTKNSTRKKYIIKYSTGQKLPFSNDLKIESGDIIFIAEKLDYNSWDRFKEWMAIISQISTTIIVIQNILGN